MTIPQQLQVSMQSQAMSILRLYTLIGYFRSFCSPITNGKPALWGASPPPPAGLTTGATVIG